MTCKDCIHRTECADLAVHNFDHAHQMWMNDFWENAEERCKNFKERKVEEVKDDAGRKVDQNNNGYV